MIETEENVQKKKTLRKQYYIKNKQYILNCNRKRRLENGDAIKNSTYKSNYDITLNEYNQMFTDQNGCCAICETPQSELKIRLAVDHDRVTGKVRGLLCPSCNIKLGWFENRRSSVLEYLNRNKDVIYDYEDEDYLYDENW